MGDHSADQPSKLREAFYWAVAHRRKLVSVAIIALPIVSRFVPDFPASQVVDYLRVFLGA